MEPYRKLDFSLPVSKDVFPGPAALERDDADALRNNKLFRSMLAAIKREIYDLSMQSNFVQSPEATLHKAGVLTGLHRSLELMELEEQRAGIKDDPAAP